MMSFEQLLPFEVVLNCCWSLATVVIEKEGQSERAWRYSG